MTFTIHPQPRVQTTADIPDGTFFFASKLGSGGQGFYYKTQKQQHADAKRELTQAVICIQGSELDRASYWNSNNCTVEGYVPMVLGIG